MCLGESSLPIQVDATSNKWIELGADSDKCVLTRSESPAPEEDELDIESCKTPSSTSFERGESAPASEASTGCPEVGHEETASSHDDHSSIHEDHSSIREKLSALQEKQKRVMGLLHSSSFHVAVQAAVDGDKSHAAIDESICRQAVVTHMKDEPSTKALAELRRRHVQCTTLAQQGRRSQPPSPPSEEVSMGEHFAVLSAQLAANHISQMRELRKLQDARADAESVRAELKEVTLQQRELSETYAALLSEHAALESQHAALMQEIQAQAEARAEAEAVSEQQPHALRLGSAGLVIAAFGAGALLGALGQRR